MDTSDMTLSSLQKLLLDVVTEEKEMAGTSIPLNFAPNALPPEIHMGLSLASFISASMSSHEGGLS